MLTIHKKFSVRNAAPTLCAACLLLAAALLGMPRLARAEGEGEAAAGAEEQRQIAEWTDLLQSPDAEKRVSGATSLLHLGSPAALEALEETLRQGREESVISVLKAVAVRSDDRFLPEAVALLGHESRRLRQTAHETLVAMRGPEAVRKVVEFALNPDAPMSGRVRACSVLADRKTLRAVEPLIGLLESDEPLLAQAAHNALKHITLMALPAKADAWAEWWENQRQKPREELLEDVILRQDRRIAELESHIEKLLIERFALQANQTEEKLAEAIKSEFPGVRQYAIRAAAQGKIEALAPDIAELLKDPAPAVRAEAAAGLAALGTQDAIPALRTALHDPFYTVRNAAARALGDLRAPQAIGDLVQSLDEPSVARSAAEALGKIGDPEAVKGLVSLLGKPERTAAARSAAATALGRLGKREATDALIRALADEEVRWFAIDALGSIGAEHRDAPLQEAVPPLSKHLIEDSKPDVREAAAVALGKIGHPKALGALARGLDDGEGRVTRQAALAFERIASDSLDIYKRHIADAKDEEAYARAARLNAMAIERFRNDRREIDALRRDRAACLRLARQWNEAKSAYEALLRDHPEDPDLYREMASVLQAVNGEEDRLLDLYAEARKTLPDKASEWWEGSLGVVERMLERERPCDAVAAAAVLKNSEPQPDDETVAEQLSELAQAAVEALEAETEPDVLSERVKRLLAHAARNPKPRETVMDILVGLLGERATEPLVEHGLGHQDAAVQQRAIEALEKITEHGFGLAEEHEAEERAEAIERWKAWWNEQRQERPEPEGEEVPEDHQEAPEAQPEAEE